MDGLSLFSGSSHPFFAQEVADYLGVKLGGVLFEPFPDREISVQILDNVRGRDVFVVESISREPNYFLMELLIMIDAFRRASANSITAVIPYYGYARQDRKDKPRVPITARLVANLLTTAGATRVLTMDLHAGQIQGFFDIPVDNLYARPALAEAVKNLHLKNLVVVAPDLGAIKKARAYANHLGADFAVIDKRRTSSETVELVSIIGHVEGRNVLLVDDLCSTAGTLVTAAEGCKRSGAQRIFAACTHGLFVGEAVAALEKSSIELLLTSNSVPLPEESRCPKIQQISVANLFGEAIRCIMLDESISSIFN